MIQKKMQMLMQAPNRLLDIPQNMANAKGANERLHGNARSVAARGYAARRARKPGITIAITSHVHLGDRLIRPTILSNHAIEIFSQRMMKHWKISDSTNLFLHTIGPISLGCISGLSFTWKLEVENYIDGKLKAN